MREHRSDRRPRTRLVLTTALVVEPQSLAPIVAASCRAADVAAVIVRLAPGGDADLAMRVHALAPSVQTSGAALLLDGRADLAVKTAADGAHLYGVDALAEALLQLKPDKIAGCAGLKTRHDSMIAAESGADYVMFGEPDEAGRRPGFDAVRERVAWWAELFEAPCVGYAATLEEAGALARAGADFVALADAIWNSPEGIGALAEAESRMRSEETAQ
jgi:thiamine-phosphate pyrophosphorylase